MRKDLLAEVYETYSGELYLYAYSLCQNHHLAQEIVSETFYKAFLSLDQCTDRIKYWLFKVCRNLVADEYRRRGRLADEPLSADTAVAWGGASAVDEPLNILIEGEARRELYQAILKLSGQYRESIVMFYFAGLSTEESARAMGISGGAFRTLLYRGRKQLKEALADSIK